MSLLFIRAWRGALVPALTAFVLLTAAAPAEARTRAEPVAALEGWRYRWGDSPRDASGHPAWANEAGDGAEWRPVVALGTPPGRDGQSWLWLSVPIPKGEWARPTLMLGSVSNAFEAWFGGERIYASGTLDVGGYEKGEHSSAQLIPLPQSAIGGRVLLRIQSNGAAIGVRRGARVGDYDLLFGRWVSSGMVPFVFGLLSLMISALAFLAFVVRVRQRHLIALTIFTLGGGLVTLFNSGVPEALWEVGRTGYLLLIFGAYLCTPSLCSFIELTVFEGRNRPFRLFTWALYAFALVASLISFGVKGGLPRVFPVYLVVMMASALACLALTAREALRGNRDARILVIGVTGLFLAGTVSALSSFAILTRVGVVLHWGLLALNLSLLGIVARRGAEVYSTLRAQTNALVDRQQAIQRLAGRMGTGAGELLTMVQQLRESAAQQNAGVSRQAAALQQADATVQEIRQTSQVAAEKALFVAASASEADEAGQAGAAALETTLRGLEAIRAEVAEMARRIQALEARTREVAGIVDTVKGLADQSNMLALNAAIEAVRSGEHGKGFGVVAREVRNLADQSIEATQRIREILDSVGTSMRETAELSRSGEERVRTSVDEVRSSGEQLRKLAVIIGETGASMRTITTAVAQQDEGTSQIANAIADLSAQMKQTLAAVQQTEAVSRSVEELARGMSGVAAEAVPAQAVTARAAVG